MMRDEINALATQAITAARAIIPGRMDDHDMQDVLEYVAEKMGVPIDAVKEAVGQ